MRYILDPKVGAKVRTVWFITAMILPVAGFFALFGLIVLMLTPIIAYAGIQGKHLKNPWGKAE